MHITSEGRKIKGFLDDLNNALLLKNKAENETKKYSLLYEKTLKQVKMTMKVAKTSKNNEHTHTLPTILEEGDKFHQLESMLKDTVVKPQHNLSDIEATPERILERQLLNEDAVAEPTSSLTPDIRLGVLHFGLPKPKKTIRVCKSMLLYHSYSMDDIRYTKNMESQTNENELTNSEVSALQKTHPIEIIVDKTQENKNDADTRVIDNQATNIISINAKVNDKICKFGRFSSASKIIPEKKLLEEYEEMEKKISLMEEELSQARICIEELTEENEKLNLDANNDVFNDSSDSFKKRNSKKPSAINVIQGQGEDLIRVLKDEDYSELQRIDSNMIGYKSTSPKKMAPIKLKPLRHRTNQNREAHSVVMSCLADWANDRTSMFKNKMPTKAMLKVITSVYNSIISSNKEMLIRFNKLFNLKKPLNHQLYAYLLNKFGNEGLATKKMKHFISAGVSNQEIPRVHLFIGFLGLTKDIEECEANLYITIIGYMGFTKIGVNIANNDMSQCHFTPYIRALDATKRSFPTLNKDAMTELVRKLDKLKEPDPKKVNTFIIDIDQMMIIILQQHHILLGKVRDYISDMFDASDLDGSKSIEFFEFFLMFKLIETSNYTFDKCKTIFAHSAEIQIEDGKSISVITFNQFVSICEAERLFSEEAQNAFLRYHKTEDHVKLVRLLRNHYDEFTSDIMIRLREYIGMSYVQKVLGKLKLCSSHDNAKEAKIAWMLYRLVDDMSAQLYIDQQADMLMGELHFDNDNIPSFKQVLLWKESGEVGFLPLINSP